MQETKIHRTERRKYPNPYNIGDFSIPLSVIVRTSQQKITEDTELNH